MPDGATHFEVILKHRSTILYSYFGLELVVVAITLRTGDWLLASFILQIYFWAVVHYFFVAPYVDPDLDQLGVSQADGRQMRIGFMGYFFFSYWTFYAAMMAMICKMFKIKGMFGSAHQSWLTHSIFPGTFIRVLFLDFPIFLVVVFVSRYVTLSSYFWIFVVPPFVVGQLLGLGQADWLHIWLDKANGEGILRNGI